MEIFSGTAGLTAAVRSFGIQGIGMYSMVTSCKSPILRLDLTTLAGQEILWNILKQKNLCGVHMAPPCGTASRAREIKRKRGPNPKPLRSPNFPDGFPWLKGVALLKVRCANTLYDLAGQVLDYCVSNNIPVSVENPHRSYFLETLSNTHRNIVLHCSNPCFIIVCLDLREGNALVCFTTAHLFVTLKSGVMIVTNTFHGAMSIPASVGLLLVKQNILQAYAEHTPHHSINTFSCGVCSLARFSRSLTMQRCQGISNSSWKTT